MKLGHDHTLGSVDHKSSVAGHQGNLAEVDLLLFNVSYVAAPSMGVHIEEDQPDRNLQRCGIGHPSLVTLLHIVFGFPEVVTDKFQGGCFIEVFDREDRLKNALKAQVLPLIREDVLLQKEIVGILLNFNQVGQIDDLLDPPEIAVEP